MYIISDSKHPQWSSQCSHCYMMRGVVMGTCNICGDERFLCERCMISDDTCIVCDRDKKIDDLIVYIP